jgi:hypothetical protein
MQLGSHARARLRKRNAVKAASKARPAMGCDPKDTFVRTVTFIAPRTSRIKANGLVNEERVIVKTVPLALPVARQHGTRADMPVLAIKALGVSEPTGKPVMVQNRLFDALEKRHTQRLNGGLTKDVQESYPPADPAHNTVPSYLDPRKRRKPHSRDGY